MAKNDKKSETENVKPSATATHTEPPVPPAPPAPEDSQGSQLGDSGDVPPPAPDKAPETDLEREGRERAEKRTALEAEAAAKEAAAQAKRERLAAEAAEEKERMRAAEKANTIPDPAADKVAGPDDPAPFDPLTCDLSLLSDQELQQQLEQLQSIEADLQATSQLRIDTLKDHEAIKQQLRTDAHMIEREWNAYQTKVNQVLLPRRSQIPVEQARREKLARERAQAEAAEVSAKK